MQLLPVLLVAPHGEHSAKLAPRNDENLAENDDGAHKNVQANDAYCHVAKHEVKLGFDHIKGNEAVRNDHDGELCKHVHLGLLHKLERNHRDEHVRKSEQDELNHEDPSSIDDHHCQEYASDEEKNWLKKNDSSFLQYQSLV